MSELAIFGELVAFGSVILIAIFGMTAEMRRLRDSVERLMRQVKSPESPCLCDDCTGQVEEDSPSDEELTKEAGPYRNAAPRETDRVESAPPFEPKKNAEQTSCPACKAPKQGTQCRVCLGCGKWPNLHFHQECLICKAVFVSHASGVELTGVKQ